MQAVERCAFSKEAVRLCIDGKIIIHYRVNVERPHVDFTRFYRVVWSIAYFARRNATSTSFESMQNKAVFTFQAVES